MPRCLWKLRQALLAESSDITGAEEPTTSSEGEATTTLTESKTCVEAIITFGAKVPEAATTEAEVPKVGSAKVATDGHWHKGNAAKAAKVGAAQAAAAKVGHWCKAEVGHW